MAANPERAATEIDDLDVRPAPVVATDRPDLRLLERSARPGAPRPLVAATPRRPNQALELTTLAMDIALVAAIFLVTGWLGALSVGPEPGGAAEPFSLSGLLVAVMAPVIINATVGYGQTHRRRGTLETLGAFFLVSTVCAWVSWLFTASVGLTPHLGQLATFWLLAPVGWLAVRPLVNRMLGRPEHVILVGTGRVARRILDIAGREDERRFRVVGTLDDDPLPMGDSGPEFLGRIDELPRVLATTDVDRVIVAFSRSNDSDTMHVLRECDRFGVEVDIVPRLFDLLGPLARPYDLGGLPILSVDGCRPPSLVRRATKRTLDFAGSAALLALFAPVMAVVAVAIMLDDGWPVFYRQNRVGKFGRPFRILKFRTMVRDADRHAATVVDGLKGGTMSIGDAVQALKSERDPRITRIGAFLRATSLDELPQLWNVLVGQMSLVGPRPLRDYEIEALEEWQASRQQVKPGITGLWQIAGRSKVQWDERMQLDYSYVRHWSLSSDLEILARTLPSVVARRGAM